MKKSESVAKIGLAISKMQNVMQAAIKDASNPFYKSKYADLEAVWAAIREPMAANELGVAQMTSFDVEAECWVIETLVMHSSGEWVSGSFPLLSKDGSAQAMGSATTYARRYALCAALGVIQTDDDGEGAQPDRAPAFPPKKGKPMPYPNVDDEGQPYGDEPPPFEPPEVAKPKERGPSVAQVNRMFAIAGAAGWPQQVLKEYVYKTYGVTSSKDIPISKYEELCTHIEKNPHRGR